MVVHFPVALLITGFISEIAHIFTRKQFFRQAGLYLLLLGAAGAVVAWFSGNAAGDGMEEGSLGRAIALHEAAATRAIWATLLAAATRLAVEFSKTRYAWAHVGAFLLYTTSIGATAQTGYLGGQLVFQHGAGVELGLDNFSNDSTLNTGGKTEAE